MTNKDKIAILRRATRTYTDRNNEDKRYRSHPKGHFTQYLTWMPDPEEVAECCKRLVIPRANSKWKWAMLKHCCTYRHVSESVGIKEKFLKKAVKSKILEKDEFRQIVMATIILNQ